MRMICAALLALLFTAPATAPAKVIGQMVPAQPLTEARISSLPPAQRAFWTAYLRRSHAQRAADKAALAAERQRITAPPPASPPEGSTKSMPLDRPAEWYRSDEARRIADNIVTYQTPAGGWGKNQDRTAPPRRPGESYVIIEHLPKEALPDIITDDSRWAFVGTIDNDATTTELRFLARAQGAASGQSAAAYRAAFLKGVRYLLEAQYPNGGWPQIYPLQGGYHDALTYNDDAIADVVGLLMDVAARKGDYAFVPDPMARRAGLAVDRAVAVILASQVVLNGKRTGWGQQHDPLTLAPVGARNFEPASLSSSESSTLLRLLMRVPNPSPRIVAAVHDGIAWLQSVAIPDVEWAKATETQPRHLAAKPGAGAVWSRFYDLKTMRPIFGDRDKTIHDDVDDLIPERRNGYSWYGTSPASAINTYAKWAVAHPRG
ncbi:MAG: pectate lyase [Sphingomicrobium sp.]